MSTKTTQIYVSDQCREIAGVVGRYEEAAGEELPDVAQLLQDVSAANRSAALLELLQVEQEHRWRRSQGKTVEEYLAEYPELSSDRNNVLQLARSECRLRCKAGDHDFRKDFTLRFPDLELECATQGDTDASATLTRPGVCKVCPLVRPKQIGHYAVEQRVGGGAFGVVYRCRHAELKSLAAVKITRTASDGDTAFLHEAQSAVALVHPNIVRLLEYGKLDDGRPYIVYDYVAGRTLAERIAAHDYTLRQAIDWTIALAGALQAAHRRRIYHRDIKPANVLIDEEGTARLTDFGMARRDGAFYVDDRGAQVGTPAYMSPEQASSRSDWAGPASDIYALGVVLYELLCGRVPFRDADVESLLKQIRECPPVSLRSLDERIPARLDEACLRALDKDPAKRFRTAGDFARALQAAIGPRTRRAWLAATATAGLAALALVCWKWPAPSGPLEFEERPQIEVIRDGMPCEVKPGLLPCPNEKMRVSAQLNSGQEAYFYVLIFCSERSTPWVLCPEDSPQAAEHRRSYFQTPADGSWAVPPGKGAMVVVVGARNKPCGASDLRAFVEKKIKWPEVPTKPPSEFRPVFKSIKTTVRGGEHETFELPPGLRKDDLERLFDTYYAVMFPWYERPKEPGSSP